MNDQNSIKKIEDDMKSNIMGQDQAIKDLVKITKKIKLGFKDDNRPYSLMFCGPSGVGKTKLAKVFGSLLVGENVIKLDMSEYAIESDITKFIGSAPGYVGYNDNKNILEK